MRQGTTCLSRNSRFKVHTALSARSSSTLANFVTPQAICVSLGFDFLDGLAYARDLLFQSFVIEMRRGVRDEVGGNHLGFSES
jgi:hypothetical protein